MNFFDFVENQGKRAQANAPATPEPITVTQLTQIIDKAIKSGVPSTVYVKGEVSNVNHHRASGHLYFTLKDSGACIDCVMFRNEVNRLKFDAQDGMELLCTGAVRIYPQRGRYQLYVTNMQPLGQGALELAFRQLREKLEKEGLFAPERKKPLPRFPHRIALVTSRQTAALQDVLKVLKRFPWLHLMLFHVPVQGDGSAELIAEAIRLLNRNAVKVRADVILLVRGGGSLEDLWEFNEEIVARAIVGSKIPVLSGIGHEVDVSIADLVADYHAHTPTEAAQVAVAHWRLVADVLSSGAMRMTRALRVRLNEARQRLAGAAKHEFFRRPLDRVNQLRQVLDDRQRALVECAKSQLNEYSRRLERAESKLAGVTPMHIIRLRKAQLHSLAKELASTAKRDLEKAAGLLQSRADQLRALSPQEVLNRGYSITTRKGQIVRSAAALKPGDRISTRFADGEAESTVEDSRQMSLFE